MSEGPDTTAFSDLYGRLVEEFGEGLREPARCYVGAQQNVREEIVRCLWFGNHFSPEEVATDDGRRIEVLSPGWWNVEGGPDFIRAELLVEGAGRVVGDVEVHTLASDWFAHGHERQATYDNVVLHVVMWNDVEGREIRLNCGRVAPQVTLAPLVESEISDLLEIVDLEGASSEGPPTIPGRYCGEALAGGEMSPEWLGRFLDCAGDHRVLAKSDAMARLEQKRAPEQVLYERVAEALGYKNNRMPFLQMAGLLPTGQLREMAPADGPVEQTHAAIEAAMFGVGGFLDAEQKPDADQGTLSYVAALRERWTAMPARLHDARMGREHWTLGGTRPVNYPARRIAALSGLYATHVGTGLLSHLLRAVASARPEGRRKLDRTVRDALMDVFVGVQHPYWSRRYSFGGKKLARPVALIGSERAQAIVVDVVLPLLLAHVRAEGDEELMRRIHMAWRGLPRRQPDSVVRRMAQVLFKDPAQGAYIVNSERRQQGLHQLHRDFCSADGGCASCLLYRVHQAGRKLEEV